MGYEPIRVIATSATSDGHVNRETTFDENPLSNKICYRDGLPYMTSTPKSLGGKGPRRVDLNGLFYLFSCFLFELQQGNYPTYNAAIVGAGKPLPDGYPLGAVLWYAAGGYFVKSLVPHNTESDLSNTNNWAKITVSAADLLQAVPTGSIQPYAGASIPSGWLLCDGSAVNRTTYSDLFSAIGIIYGPGDGSTTFNIPNYLNKTFWGGTAKTLGDDPDYGIRILYAGLPNIIGSFGLNGASLNSMSGPFSISSQALYQQAGTGSFYNAQGFLANFNLSSVNQIYGNSATVQPDAIRTPFIIKY